PVVDAVVDFPNPVVADIGVGESRGEVGRVRRGPLVEAARAGDCCSQGASRQFQADGTWGQPGGLHRSDGIHHAVPRIRDSLSTGFRNGKDERVADVGTQALIAAEEEELVFHDRPAHYAAELLQLGWQLVAYSRDIRVSDAVSNFIPLR